MLQGCSKDRRCISVPTVPPAVGPAVPCHPGVAHSCRDRTEGAEGQSRCPLQAVTLQDRHPVPLHCRALLLSRSLWLEKL